MKHTSFSPAAAVCILAAPFIFTPALASESTSLETVFIGEADNTGRRVRIMRITRSFATVQTGSGGAGTPGSDRQSCQRHQTPGHDPAKNTANKHIPQDNTVDCQLFKPASN